MFIYQNGKWISRVADLSQVLPEQNRQEFLPPYSAVATLRTNLSCTDNKLGFSTDKVTFIDDLTVDIGDSYFVEWTSGINTATQGSTYTSEITVNYLDIDTVETINVQIIGVDKLPDPFTLTPQTNTLSDATVESNTIAMLGSINAPTYLWGSSDSSNAQVNIADTGWQSIPATSGLLVISSKDEVRTRHFTNNGSETVTTTTINIGYSDEVGGFESADFVTTNESIGVQQPQITYPNGTSTAESIWSMPINTSGYGIIGNAGGLASTLWEIATDEEFTNVVFTESVSGSNVNYNIPPLTLDTLSTYYARATFISSLGYSAASLPVEFTTGRITFTYLDVNKTSEALPAGLTQYHTILRINASNGGGGANGIRGQGLTDGSPGAGGTQGLIRYTTSLVGSQSNISLSNNSGSQLTYTQATSGQDGNFDFGTEQIATGASGSVVNVDDVFDRAIIFSGGPAGANGTGENGNNGGGGGGGAGGLQFSYVSVGSPTDDGTWTSNRATPSSYPSGSRGGDNQPVQERRAYGGEGGVGWGAGGGGGAGGAEKDGQLGNPGAGAGGAGGGSVIAIL